MEGQHKFKQSPKTRTPLTIVADELLENTDPGVKIASIFMESERGDMEAVNGPFTREQVQLKVQEFCKKTRSAIIALDLDPIH